MLINEPCIITPRLLPGLKLGEAFISIEYSSRPGDDGRDRYRWHIDLPEGEFSDDDLQSGCQGGSLTEGLSSLLSFLTAAAESYSYRERTGREGENEDLFPAAVVAWAADNSDDLSSLQCAIEEAGEPVICE